MFDEAVAGIEWLTTRGGRRALWLASASLRALNISSVSTTTILLTCSEGITKKKKERKKTFEVSTSHLRKEYDNMKNETKKHKREPVESFL